MLELASEAVLPSAPPLPVIQIGTEVGPRCIQRTWLFLGDPLGSLVQKEEGKCVIRKGGEGTLKLNEKELLAKSKIKQTKRNKNFYSYIIINMELYIIIKRIVNCKQIISTVSGRDPAILLSY